MAVLTGSDGQLLYGTQAFAKCRDWSITVTRDSLEDTCLGDYDRYLQSSGRSSADIPWTYVQGLRGTTGSATLLYDPGNSLANNFLNTVFDDASGNQEVTFKLNRRGLGDGGGSFKCQGFITSVSPSVSVGNVQAVSVSFQVSGKPEGNF